jgi:hypothetical protein
MAPVSLAAGIPPQDQPENAARSFILSGTATAGTSTAPGSSGRSAQFAKTFGTRRTQLDRLVCAAVLYAPPMTRHVMGNEHVHKTSMTVYVLP